MNGRRSRGGSKLFPLVKNQVLLLVLVLVLVCMRGRDRNRDFQTKTFIIIISPLSPSSSFPSSRRRCVGIPYRIPSPRPAPALLYLSISSSSGAEKTRKTFNASEPRTSRAHKSSSLESPVRKISLSLSLSVKRREGIRLGLRLHELVGNWERTGRETRC